MNKSHFDFRLIFPKTIGNTYSGNIIPKILFYIVILFTIVRSLIHIFAHDGGAMSIATIPLDKYPSAAANTVIYLFGVWGLSQLIMGVFYLIVSLRYKSLIPLMYIFVAFEYAMRLVIGHMKPVVTAGTAPGAVGNYILIPLALTMFFLSIWKKADSQQTGNSNRQNIE